MIGSEAVRHPLQQMHPATRAGLIEIARRSIRSCCAGAASASCKAARTVEMNGAGDGKSAASTEAGGGPAARQGIPAGVWILGFVSMLMDISSEMIHALLPVYMVTVLGTSTLAVGIIEGIAEATASITKVFSGALSDWLGKRKVLAALGYGLAAFTKPIFRIGDLRSDG